MASYKVGIIIGSLRKESFSRQVALNLKELLPEVLDAKLIEIEDLSFYNQDFDEKSPESWEKFRDQVRECQGLIFVTPEYNRSMPGVLKNAIDIGSRPPGKNVWQNKSAAVLGVSPGKLGASGSCLHLRQVLVAVGMAALPQPEVYLSNITEALVVKNKLNEKTQEFLKTFIQEFEQWIVRNT